MTRGERPRKDPELKETKNNQNIMQGPIGQEGESIGFMLKMQGNLRESKADRLPSKTDRLSDGLGPLKLYKYRTLGFERRYLAKPFFLLF